MKQIIILLASIFGTSIAMAGGVNGNGGGGIECKSGNRIYDFVAAEVPHVYHPRGIKIEGSGESVEAQVFKAFDRLKEFHNSLSLKAKELYYKYQADDNLRWESDDFPVPPPKDAHLSPVPRDCAQPNGEAKFFGLAMMDDAAELLRIQKSRYDSLKSNTERAGIWVHEIVYLMFREIFKPEIKDSYIPSAITAYLFSDLPMDDIFLLPGMPNREIIEGYFKIKSGETWITPTNLDQKSHSFKFKNSFVVILTPV